jgi:uroporphyrinogen-III synthase
MRLLVTRPEPGASATAAALAARGHAALLAPCLQIEPLPVRLPAQAAALIITSGQAVAALPAAWAETPVYCVGDATAARLRQAGFHRVESAAGDARDLARLIIARRRPGLHVMAVGERHGLALARQLRAAEIAVVRRTVYRARPLRALGDAAAAALREGGLDGVLFYSAESARAFARLAPSGTAPLTAYALSAAVASAAQALPWTKIRVAVAPTEADMMALLDD